MENPEKSPYLKFAFSQKDQHEKLLKYLQKEQPKFEKQGSIPASEEPKYEFLITYNAGTHHGVCSGFSMTWIAAKLFDSSEGKHGAQSSRKGRLMDSKTGYLQAATRAQTWWQVTDERGFDQGTTPGLEDAHPLNAAEEYPEKRELRYAIIVTETGGSGFSVNDPFIKRINAVKGGCTQLNIPVSIDKSSGRHAIAFYRSQGDKVYIFDSNHGEFQVKHERLDEWLNAYIKKMYKLTFKAPGGWSLWRWYYHIEVRVDKRFSRSKIYGQKADVQIEQAKKK